MIRGTTAQFNFKLPYSKEDVTTVEVVFWQPNNSGLNEDYPLPIKKGYVQEKSSDGTIVTGGPWNWVDDHTLSVKLWQQETLTFSDKYKAKAQLRAIARGEAFGSAQEYITVYPIYGDEPIGDEIIPTPDDEGWIILDGENIE